MSSEAIAQAIFLLLTMSIAGIAHVIWLRSDIAQCFAWPVDGGLHFRGRRLFGDNKRVCGFMVLPLAAAMIFMLFGGARKSLPSFFTEGLWECTPIQYGIVGLLCGLAFMLAELPNSFLKRQLDIAPGQVSTGKWMRPVTMLIDRIDSVLGVLIMASILLPVPFATWLLVLILGPVLHALFSVSMHILGIKARAL